MVSYTILQNPGHNRVYFEAAKKLSINELSIASLKLSVKVNGIMTREIGGVHYFVLECGDALSAKDVALISRLSPTYAIFEIVTKADTEYLLPVEKENSYFFGDNLNTILKYSGKTNEIFTRLMINTAVLASDFDWDEQLNVLDPLCGKATTNYEALTLGYNAYGLEINEKMLHETRVYFKKYLEMGRYKHSYSVGKAAPEDKKYITDRHRFSFARSKDDMKNNVSLCLEMLAGDCVHADKYFKKESMHIIVGDLPYGVMHSNKSIAGKSRSPLALLESALPVWYKLLKHGGAIALAYNSFVLKKDAIVQLMLQNNYEPVEEEFFCNFSHRVDQAILRDIIVCRKNKG